MIGTYIAYGLAALLPFSSWILVIWTYYTALLSAWRNRAVRR